MHGSGAFVGVNGWDHVAELVLIDEVLKWLT